MGRMSRFLPRCCLAAFLLEISLGDSLLGTQQEEPVGLIVSFIGCGMGRNKQAEVFLSSKKVFLGRQEGKCFYLRSVALVLFSCFLYRSQAPAWQIQVEICLPTALPFFALTRMPNVWACRSLVSTASTSLRAGKDTPSPTLCCLSPLAAEFWWCSYSC